MNIGLEPLIERVTKLNSSLSNVMDRVIKVNRLAGVIINTALALVQVVINVVVLLLNTLNAIWRNKKLMAIIIGAGLGVIIGITTQGFSPATIVIISVLIIIPFILAESLYGLFGEELLFLGAGALVGGLIGTFPETGVNSIGGALTGAGILAIIQAVVTKFKDHL
jgi:hypothetical protein